MNPILKRRVNVISILLTILNAVFTCFLFWYFGIEPAVIAASVIVQIVIVLSYFIIYQFSLLSANNFKEIKRLQEDMQVKFGLLEQKMVLGLGEAVNDLKSFEQKTMEQVVQQMEEKKSELSNLLATSSENTGMEANLRKEEMLKLNEKVSSLYRDMNSVKEQELDNSNRLNVAIEDLKQHVNIIKVQEEDAAKNIKTLLGTVAHSLEGIKVQELDAANKIRKTLGDLFQNIDNVKIQEANSAKELKTSIGEVPKFIEELKKQELEISDKLQGTINELRKYEQESSDALKNSINELKGQEFASSDKIKGAIDELKKGELESSNALKNSINELKGQGLASSDKIKGAIDELKKGELESSKTLKDSINELKGQGLISSDKIKVAIDELKKGELESSNAFKNSINELKSQTVGASDVLKTAIQQLHEYISAVKAQDVETEQRFNEALIVLSEKINHLKDQGAGSIAKLEVHLTDINKIAANQIEKVTVISSKVNNLVEQIEMNGNLNTQGNASLINNLKELKVEYQTKANDLKNNLTNLMAQVDRNKKEIDFSSTKILDLISNKMGWLDRSTKSELSYIYDRIDSLFSIHRMIDIKSPLPVMNDWAITSDYALDLVKTTLSKVRGNVIDVGSGVSTLIFGYILQKRGQGKVIALEHDKNYFKSVQRMVKEHHLEEFVELYHCPLKEYTINKKKWMWYDISKVKFPPDITIVNIDGPPGITQELARFPAVPLLLKHIRSNTTVMLDDGGREDEQKVAAMWAFQYNFKMQFNKSHKGHFVFQLK
ncbi:MAG: class I SAM-dependent methyltransferase [Bacteroidota bacterium]